VRQHYVFKVKAIFTQVGNLMSDELIPNLIHITLH